MASKWSFPLRYEITSKSKLLKSKLAGNESTNSTLCKSSCSFLQKADHGKPFQIIALYLLNPSPLNFSDCIILHEALHNCTTSSIESKDFFLLNSLLFCLSIQQGLNTTSNKNPYMDFVSLMYWVGCLIGRTLQRGTTYDELPSEWMKLCPYSNSPRDNHLDMAAGRISFKHELPKQMAYLVLHGWLLLPDKLPIEWRYFLNKTAPVTDMRPLCSNQQQ
jgi:hypothetical protein